MTRSSTPRTPLVSFLMALAVALAALATPAPAWAEVPADAAEATTAPSETAPDPEATPQAENLGSIPPGDGGAAGAALVGEDAGAAYLIGEEAAPDAQEPVAGADRRPTQEELDAAQAKVDALQQSLDTLNSQLPLGSLGFFIALKDQNAYNDLVNATYASYTKAGEDGDATSIANLKAAVKIVEAINEMRDSIGISELLITPQLTADAESNANYSDKNIAHSGQFNVGETLAWNDIEDLEDSVDSAINQRYYREQIIWDDAYEAIVSNGGTSFTYDGVTYELAASDFQLSPYELSQKRPDFFNKVGQYRNIINEDYDITGAAICTRGSLYPNTFSVVFGHSRPDTKGYTTENFNKLIDAYLTGLPDKISATEAELAAAQQELADLKEQAEVWERLWGQVALDTMQAIGAEFGTTSYAVVTTNANFKDALAASCLAGRYNALVLTTAKGSLSKQTAAALKAAGVKTVFVVGTTSDVSANAFNQIKKVSGVTSVTRIAGSSPSVRAVNVAKKCGKRSDTVIIATQGSFKDALSISPYSYATKSPILYAETNKALSTATLSYIKSAGYKKAIIVGGPVALPASIDSQLKKYGVTTVTRLAGGDSYGTSEVIARWATGQYSTGQTVGTYKGKALAYVNAQPSTRLGADRLAVATSQSWKDALCGAALCGRNGSVLLLGDATNSWHAVGFCEESAEEMFDAYVLGGPVAVSAGVWDELVAATN